MQSDKIKSVASRKNAEDEEDTHNEANCGDNNLRKKHIDILRAVDEKADDALDNNEDVNLA